MSIQPIKIKANIYFDDADLDKEETDVQISSDEYRIDIKSDEAHLLISFDKETLEKIIGIL